MYKLLLKNRVTNSIFLVLLLILLRINLLIQPLPASTNASGFLYNHLCGEQIFQYDWIVSTFLLIVQIYILLDLCLRFKISSELTLIPGLTFVLIACLIPELGHFQPIMIANTFLLFALNQLFGISSKQASESKIYNIGLWIALATMMYSTYILLVIAFVSGINILRSYRMRDLKVLILGFLTPYFLIGVYFYWTDRLLIFQSEIFREFGLVTLGSVSANPFYWGVIVFISIGIAILILNKGSILLKKTNIRQNYFRTIYWVLLTCFFMLLLQKNITIHHLGVLIVPMSILASELLIVSRPAVSKAVINIVLILIVAYQFKYELQMLF